MITFTRKPSPKFLWSQQRPTAFKARLCCLLALLLGLWAPIPSRAAILQPLHMEWSYQTLPPGLAGYNIYQNGQLIGTFQDPALFFADLNVYLETGQQNSFTVTGVDAYGGESTPSAPYIVDVPAEDDNGNVPPIPSLKLSSTSGDAPLILDCDAAGSYDFDGTIASYSWDFGDGATSPYATTNHIYKVPGTYTVRLTVTDNDGGTASAQASVNVTGEEVLNTPPVASIYVTTSSGEAPLAVLLDGSSSTDSDGTISQYSWDFGDGYSGTGAFVNHTYSSTGTFTAILTVTDNEGKTASAQTVITVTAPVPLNQPPTAVITASPLTGVAPLNTSFSGAGSIDADGTITAYEWDFGDGTTGSGLTVSHQYGIAGTYVATLTVWDNSGAKAQTNVTITATKVAATTPVSRFSDDFSVDTSANYTVINGALTVSGGTAHGKAYTDTRVFHKTPLDRDDQYVEADVRYSGKSQGAGILVRVDSTLKTGYLAYLESGYINLAAISGASKTWLGRAGGTYADGTYKLRMEAEGSTIRIFVNGQLMVERQDTKYATGKYVGLRFNQGAVDADMYADNLAAGIFSTDMVDDFSADTSASYTPIIGVMSVVNGAAHGKAYSDTRVLSKTPIESDDQFVEADARYSGKSQGAGLLLRGDIATGTGYLAYFESGYINLAAASGSTKLWLARSGGAYAEGTYKLRMEAEGTTVRIFVNGKLALEKSDAKYATGKHAGLRFNQGPADADMFADNLTAGILK
ncbi:PKD domain-containing protein [Thiovibrio sp. JS02]